jgi:DNA-directed RNA polymerase II subunit RPB2
MEIQIKEPITQGDYCDEETLQNISWEIIRKYFDKQYLERLVRHQRESYNYFINNQIKETIQMFNPVIIHSEHDKDPETGIYSLEIEINFDNFQMFLPKIYENNGAVKLMFPQEARLRNFTYSSPMMIDINVKVINRTGKNLSKVEILHTK